MRKFAVKKLVITLVHFLLISFISTRAQETNHWETVVYASDSWSYFIGKSEPPVDWNKLSFVDSSWDIGPGGIGYGDGDDATEIETTISLYMRNKFSIVDTTIVSDVIFNIDFDDAFVAYLNGVEIARSTIGSPGDRPAYDQNANGFHEAALYRGGQPDYFFLTPDQVDDLLVQGENVLAIQVHNENITS
ncbi:MAG: hypothetical protein GY808_09170, partial [Gammaproteobacteria bacterium]|nr:hypothetical protein [Gammaproteobacteria bacterium]